MDEEFKKQVIDIIVFKLIELIGNDISINSILSFLSKMIRMDERTNKSWKILRLNPDNRTFCDESKEIIDRAIAELTELIAIIDDIPKNIKQSFIDKLNLIREFLDSKKPIEDEKPVRIITIPAEGEFGSVLDYDLVGKGCTTCMGGKTRAPHNYDFSKNSPLQGAKPIEFILDELGIITEEVTHNPVLSKSQFKSEKNGIGVRHNTHAATRIPLIEYNRDEKGRPVILIAGIFKKHGNDDDDVQKEYETRSKIVDKMKIEGIPVDRCEQEFNKFLYRLVEKKYGKNIRSKDAIMNYMWYIFSEATKIDVWSM